MKMQVEFDIDSKRAIKQLTVSMNDLINALEKNTAALEGAK